MRLKKKTSKVNIFKSAASVAHTRTACSLSSAADYFFSEKNHRGIEKWKRGEVMSGSTTHEKQLQSTTSSSPPATTADPRLPTTQGSAYKTLQRVSERRDRNQSRMAGSNLISRRPRRCLRSERTTLQTTVLVSENLTTCSITVTDLLLQVGIFACCDCLTEHASTGALTNPAFVAPSSILSETKLNHSDNSSST